MTDQSHAAYTFGSGFEQLRAWALDEAHLVQSVRMHEPTYRNPGELRADVRELLARFDVLSGENAMLRAVIEEPS